MNIIPLLGICAVAFVASMMSAAVTLQERSKSERERVRADTLEEMLRVLSEPGDSAAAAETNLTQAQRAKLYNLHHQAKSATSHR